jgi:hypothetical protein
MPDNHDPLNPDSEQRLFEKLSNSDEDLADLETIRRMMRVIVEHEQRGKTENKNNFDYSNAKDAKRDLGS